MGKEIQSEIVIQSAEAINTAIAGFRAELDELEDSENEIDEEIFENAKDNVLTNEFNMVTDALLKFAIWGKDRINNG